MDQKLLAQVLNPIQSARGLANAHYIDNDVFQTEKHKLLFDSWSGIGFARDVPDIGDVAPVDFLGMPLLVVHGHDGVVRVFQNTCRHRGMVLVSEKKNIGTGVIRCPYHSWCYAQDGALVATPHVGGPGVNSDPAIQPETLGLTVIRSAIWRDVIFVNISGTAPQFVDHAADLMARWGEFERQPLISGGDDSCFDFSIRCNWKLAVENFCESYHLPWIHPGLNSNSKLEDHYHIEMEGEYSGQGSTTYRASLSRSGQKFPDFANLGQQWDSGAEYVALYPNVLFGVHRDHAFALILTPLATDQTLEKVALYYASTQACNDEFADLRRANSALWQSVLAEDIFVLEGMQRGRHGVFFDGGRFSPVMDSPTWCFHQWVAQRLTNVNE